MDDTTPQENSQITTDQAKAALGNATFLQEQLLTQMNPQQKESEGPIGTESPTESPTGAPTEAPVEPQNAPQEAQTTELPKEPSEDFQSLKDEISALREEIKKQSPQDEIADIKRELEELLNEDGDQTES